MSTRTLTRDDEVTEKEPAEPPALVLVDEESDDELMAWIYARGGVERQEGASTAVSQ